MLRCDIIGVAAAVGIINYMRREAIFSCHIISEGLAKATRMKIMASDSPDMN
jgi:hypothetical protein